MSPSIVNKPTDTDFDLQKWLKEIEGAENLMNEVETKADNLQAKVDALLLEVGLPTTTTMTTTTNEVSEATEAVSKVTIQEKKEETS